MSRRFRRRYSRRQSWWRRSLLPTAIGLVLALIAGGLVWNLARPLAAANPKPTAIPCQSASDVTSTPTSKYLVSTTATADEQGFALPATTLDQLQRAGEADASIEVIRVTPEGDAATRTVDLTPRIGSSTKTLKVPERRYAKIGEKIENLTTSLNCGRSGSGSRSLFNGLLRAEFADDADITIVSSGLDLQDPLDFRTLRWNVPATTTVARLRAAHELPRVHGARITFALVSTAKPQPQLRTELETAYLKDVWTQVLLAGGARSVDFIAAPAARTQATLTAPVVQVGATTRTPFKTCEIRDTAFKADTATLLHRGAVEQSISSCIKAALNDASKVTIDAWTSYIPPLTEAQQVRDERLSTQRARAVQALMEDVPSSAVTIVGHGSKGQPYPFDHTSAMNRIARITVSPAS